MNKRIAIGPIAMALGLAVNVGDGLTVWEILGSAFVAFVLVLAFPRLRDRTEIR